MPLSEAHLIDNMEYMKGIPDLHFELAIVDPPYGIGISNRTNSIGQKKGQGRTTKYLRKEWDSSAPGKEYFEELFRVSKNQIIFGANYFSNLLPPSRCWIAYDKLQPEGVSFAMIELAYTSFDIGAKLFRTSRANMQNCVSNNDAIAIGYAKIHPAQKPVQFYEWALGIFAKPGDKIFDSHMGSQSSRIAAYQAGLDYYGCELDADYYRDGCKRFEDFRKHFDSSPPLFKMEREQPKQESLFND